MPGCSGGLVVTNARVYYTTRAAAGASARGIPHALKGRKFHARLGRIAPRDRGSVSEEYERATPSVVIARLDRATQYSRDAGDGIEKPRRTGYPAGACHRARRRRDPVAGYDGGDDNHAGSSYPIADSISIVRCTAGRAIMCA